MPTTSRSRQCAALCGGLALSLSALFAATGETPPAPLPAFPGAEGFGALATGGRGGEIYHVTTLNDAGPGSFRDAVSQPGRVVIFDVGGIIKLADNVQVSSNTTVLGQTAPGEGICIYGKSVSLSGQRNIVLRYLRLRQGAGGDRGKCSLNVSTAQNMTLDHLSLEWGRWDNLGITVNSTNITLQYCISAEAINPQWFGALVDNVNNVTLSHNLWQSNQSRNPKAKGTVQYINNVVYNWGETGLCGGHSEADRKLDVIGNYFIAGPVSNDRFAGQFYASDHVFQAGNVADLDRDGQLNGKPVTPDEFHRPNEKTYTLPTFMPAPGMQPAVPVTVDSAADAYAKIVAGVGCSLRRDAVDARIIEELTSLGKKGRVHLPDEAAFGGLGEVKGGTAPADADKDGLPDAWETAHKLDPKNPADAAKLDASGYMNIEVYANSLVAAAPAAAK